MAQTYPVDITREVDRRWQRRSVVSTLPVPRNDNHADAHCPACNAGTSIAPAALRYVGGGPVHHRRHCDTCGHAWTTTAQIPA